VLVGVVCLATFWFHASNAHPKTANRVKKAKALLRQALRVPASCMSGSARASDMIDEFEEGSLIDEGLL
jgi:hypothetical protein